VIPSRFTPAALAFVLLFARPPAAPAQDTAAVEARLQALLDDAVDNGSTPGIMMRVEAPGSGLSFSGVAGVVDLATGAALTPDNPVRIASNTKTFLAADTTLTTVEGAGQGPDLSGMPMVPGRYRMGVEVLDRDGVALYMHTGFWGTLAAYLPGPDVAIAIAVTQQQSRALFRVFAGALELLDEAVLRVPEGN
jgi:CubicO group peptidase (beta-lactamase class C family)